MIGVRLDTLKGDILYFYSIILWLGNYISTSLVIVISVLMHLNR